MSELPSHDVAAAPVGEVSHPPRVRSLVRTSHHRPTKVGEVNVDRPGAGAGPVHAVYDVNPTFSMRSSSVAFTVDPVTFGFIR
jgi:hypothetical protein